MVEKKGGPVLVMFYDQFCPHCALMMPHFEKFAEEFKGKITFARIDVSKNPYSVERYGIMSTHAFKFFCAGARCRRLRDKYIQLSRLSWIILTVILIT